MSEILQYLSAGGDAGTLIIAAILLKHNARIQRLELIEQLRSIRHGQAISE